MQDRQDRIPRWVVKLVATLVLLVLAWPLRDVAMVAFGALIVTALLRALSDPLSRRTHLPARVSVVLVALALIALFALAMWGLGAPLAQQLQELRNALPRALEGARSWLEGNALGAKVLELSRRSSQAELPWAKLADAASLFTGALGSAVLLALMGLYLALDPGLYLRGFLRLWPPRLRPLIEDAMGAAGKGLRGWMLGQAVSMALVGATVAVGLLAMGMPLALALGLIAGLFEFVPYFGAIAAALLAVLVAFAQGPTAALKVALFFLVIQQLEGNLLMPIVQRWAVHLPPVMGLLAVVVFGTLFGVAGVVFGTPLMVVAMILTRRLYIEGFLERQEPAGP